LEIAAALVVEPLGRKTARGILAAVRRERSKAKQA
jgi:hypothetical protein